MWKKPPPISRKKILTGEDRSAIGNAMRRPRNKSAKEILLKGLIYFLIWLHPIEIHNENEMPGHLNMQNLAAKSVAR